jgi:2-aminoethylphosphonate dioxygenase
MQQINYKLAGSGGFAAHIDAPAYMHIKNVKHLTILLAVDPSTMSNGGLEAVPGSHKTSIPLNSDLVIPSDWVASQTWMPIELQPGELLVFGSYLAHRSGPNTSDRPRKAIYATYNRASEGDLHAEYYANRRKLWPATHMRKESENYDEGRLIDGFGSSMLSVDAGKQLLF